MAVSASQEIIKKYSKYFDIYPMGVSGLVQSQHLPLHIKIFL
jgi:hypothetical protein